MEKEQLQAVLNQVSEEVQQKINSISEEVKINDIQEILETLGIINKQQNIEAGGITETEKNRFNSKFEILKGEELDNENVLKVVEAVKDNIINAQVDTNEEIKIEILSSFVIFPTHISKTPICIYGVITPFPSNTYSHSLYFPVPNTAIKCLLIFLPFVVNINDNH